MIALANYNHLKLGRSMLRPYTFAADAVAPSCASR
jgi:hypothetical protein